MIIAYTCNRDYLRHTIVSIYSLLTKGRGDRPVRIMLVAAPDLKYDDLRPIDQMVSGFPGCSFTVAYPQDEDDRRFVSDGSCVLDTEAVQVACYRLFLPELLNGESRCIFLDGDTVILRSITELYDMDMKGASIAGVTDRLCLGYMPGVPLMALNAMLTSLVSFNNEIKRSYISAGVMAAGNAAGDLMLVGYGTFGIGLASTISSFLALMILLPVYLNNNKLLHFERSVMDFGLVVQAASRGLPILLFTGGLVVKNTLMNQTMSTYFGNDGVAVVNVLLSVCSLVGIFTGGCVSAYSTLASLYVGEEDRSGLLLLFRNALCVGESFCLIAVTALFAGSGLLSELFFPEGGAVREMGRQMFCLGFLFFPINLILNLMLNTYQAQGRMKLINILSASETTIIGLTVFLLVPRLGSSAAWLANTWVDIFCLLVVVTVSWIIIGRVDLKAGTLLQLKEDFGASEEEYREYSVQSLNDVSAISEAVTDFCGKRGVKSRNGFFAGLCVEEMIRNITTHGFKAGKRSFADVRVTVRNGLIIRIRDNCPEFDPLKRISLYEPKNPEENIGIRLTAKIAGSMDYYNNAGINTLIIRI